MGLSLTKLNQLTATKINFVQRLTKLQPLELTSKNCIARCLYLELKLRAELMKIRMKQFVEFAYGDRRKDKALASQILVDSKKEYDPSTDRYKQFREALLSLESGAITTDTFLDLHRSVTQNKKAGYEKLCKNYLALKEDHSLVWEGPHKITVQISGLTTSSSWYMRTEASNMRRIIFLNLQKDSFPRNEERGLLTLMQIAEPTSSGVGILNIQPSTLVVGTRIDENILLFLESRAKRFIEIASTT